MFEKILAGMAEKIKDLKISDKMRKSFTMIMVSYAVPIILAVIGILIMNLKNGAFYHKYYNNMKDQLEARMEVEIIEKDILWALEADNADESKTRIEDAGVHTGNLETYLKNLASNMDTRATEEQLNAAAQKVMETGNSLIDLLKNGKLDDASALYDSNFSAEADELMEVLEGIGSYADNAAGKEYKQSSFLGYGIDILIIIMEITSSLICVKLAYMLSDSIKGPLKELGQASRKLRDGELDISIEYVSHDEMGQLADDFRDTCEQIRDVIQDCGTVLEEMSSGNFQVHLEKEEKFVGEFERLVISLRKLNRQLSDTLMNINEASDQVAIGSGQMADSAQALAEGATDQAGAIDQLTVNVENVTKIAQESAKNASGAAEMIRESGKEAKKCHEEMELLVEAMNRITETSHEIENIIGAIEDIASQTNLLSLNASIEAARAGEAGRGFAVVADQIGSLAADSAKSAVTTRELIGKSLAEINNGNEITNRTMEVMGSVLSAMLEFADIAGASAKASEEQADMLINVEHGIEQISSVVQNNSASAEETSAVSQELSAEAETLRGMVLQFKLREE